MIKPRDHLDGCPIGDIKFKRLKDLCRENVQAHSSRSTLRGIAEVKKKNFSPYFKIRQYSISASKIIGHNARRDSLLFQHIKKNKGASSEFFGKAQG